MSRKKWTEEDLRILTEMYPGHFASEIAAVLGRETKTIYHKARVLGLHADPDHQSRAGKIGAMHPKSVATRFRKGHVPASKGKPMPAEVYAKAAPTMFKAGNVPHNHLPVGTEVVRSDGYVWVKVAEPKSWKQKQRVLWESVNGPIPPGHNVQFRNKNRLDIRIENLYLISRQDQMRCENSLIASYPKPVADLIRLNGALKRQIRRHEQNGK